MASITEPSGYVLEPCGRGVDFTLYRGRQHGNRIAGPRGGANRRTAFALQGLAARARILSLQSGTRILRGQTAGAHSSRRADDSSSLTDPGGEPLDRVIAGKQKAN